MDLTALLDSAPADTWASHLQELRTRISIIPPNRAIKDLAQRMSSFLKAGDKNQVVNCLAIGLLGSPDFFLQVIRRRGFLRFTTYDFTQVVIPDCLSILFSQNISDYITPDNSAYLSSIELLHTIGLRIITIHERLLTKLKVEGEAALKGTLAIVDAFFLMSLEHGPPNKRGSTKTDTLEYFCPVELCEAWSYIFFAYSKYIKRPVHNVLIEVAHLQDHSYEQLLLDAGLIRKFFEIEILIDFFDYKLSMEHGLVLALHGPTDEFEKTIALGFIHHKMQEMASRSNSLEDVVSLANVAETLCNAIGDKYITYKPMPIGRYVIGLPCIPELINEIQSNHLFHEEQLKIEWAAKSLLASIEDVLNFSVADNVTIMDLLHVQRVVLFLAYYASKPFLKLMANGPKNTNILLQSLIPCFSKEELTELLSWSVPSIKIESIIKLMSWDPRDNKIFDVQYQPFVAIGNNFWLPTYVSAGSNVIRNTLKLVEKHLYEEGTTDPVSEGVARVLRLHTKKVFTHKKYRYCSVTNEIDVLAIIDNRLFVFECKNSLLPGGLHELRVSLDYVQKAAEQLIHFINGLSDTGFLKSFGKSINVTLGDVKSVHSGIITTNRMFYGHRISGHPIRGFYELLHFVEEGTIRMGNEERSYWEGKKFSGSDLARFLDSNLIADVMHQAVQVEVETLVFEDVAVQKNAYSLDMVKVADSQGFKVFKDIV